MAILIATRSLRTAYGWIFGRFFVRKWQNATSSVSLSLAFTAVMSFYCTPFFGGVVDIF